jgi:hypothetical protein
VFLFYYLFTNKKRRLSKKRIVCINRFGLLHITNLTAANSIIENKMLKGKLVYFFINDNIGYNVLTHNLYNIDAINKPPPTTTITINNLTFEQLKSLRYRWYDNVVSCDNSFHISDDNTVTVMPFQLNDFLCNLCRRFKCHQLLLPMTIALLFILGFAVFVVYVL